MYMLEAKGQHKSFGKFVHKTNLCLLAGIICEENRKKNVYKCYKFGLNLNHFELVIEVLCNLEL